MHNLILILLCFISPLLAPELQDDVLDIILENYLKIDLDMNACSQVNHRWRYKCIQNLEDKLYSVFGDIAIENRNLDTLKWLIAAGEYLKNNKRIIGVTSFGHSKRITEPICYDKPGSDRDNYDGSSVVELVSRSERITYTFDCPRYVEGDKSLILINRKSHDSYNGVVISLVYRPLEGDKGICGSVRHFSFKEQRRNKIVAIVKSAAPVVWRVVSLGINIYAACEMIKMILD